MSNDYYFDRRVAEAYDAEHRGSSAGHNIVVDDIPFYVALARAAATRGERVLELGCGTGRVTIPMAQAGAEVVGLDNAAPMLDVARRKAETLALQNLTWLQADMANFVLETRFGLVVIPFRSFQMLLSVEQQRSCLACVREHLVEGGRLTMNLLNPAPIVAAGRIEGPNGTRRGLLITHEAREPVEGLPETTAGEPSHSRGIVARVERNLRLHYVFRDEMELLLTSAGFAVEALYGWFDGRPFDAQSSEMVWLVGKA